MAETSVQTRPSERKILRRSEHYPSRDILNFSPFAMMRRLSEEMDRAFARSFGLFGEAGESEVWSPAVDVRERNGQLEIVAELPGMKKDEIKVECTEEGVIIQGERRREHEETEGGYRRSERSYGRFYRMIPLPEGAETDKAKADFKDGLLQVRIPVPESKRQSRQIPIGG